ncbi:G-protein coupled receptor 4-like [Cyprinodon tularosa]|uniref:G-protein coupled receptor 4-like n=1 Tax=Cyprinodon tularosa TaxID=77115 RepID=UPI0018E21314|nr:G-protein coupled receptor 4-like [Cyprinodon tularosa]
MKVVYFSIIGVGIFVTLAALSAVFSMLKKDNGAPVFIINLLISDLIQLSTMTALLLPNAGSITMYTYFLGLMISVGFMICISIERYLLIAKPLWYKFKRDIKMTVLICVFVWVFPLILIPNFYLFLNCEIRFIIGVILLIPFPFFIFFLFGTVKALSTCVSVPAVEKTRIVLILVIVLLMYSMLFLPIIILFISDKTNRNSHLERAAPICVFLSPLVDSAMYILMKKDVLENISSLCHCCKNPTNQQTNSNDESNMSVIETV